MNVSLVQHIQAWGYTWNVIKADKDAIATNELVTGRKIRALYQGIWQRTWIPSICLVIVAQDKAGGACNAPRKTINHPRECCLKNFRAHTASVERTYCLSMPERTQNMAWKVDKNAPFVTIFCDQWVENSRFVD